MSELTDFSSKLSACDRIALTPVSEDRIYCRFLLEEQYMDRMFVTDPGLVAELSRLCGEGREVDAGGVARLRQTLLVA